MLEPSTCHSICLSSFACQETFPKNSPTDFSNTLPVPLTGKDNRRLYLRLKMVGVCTMVHEDLEQPASYIKIHISELEPQQEGLKSSQCAGGFPFPPPDIYSWSFSTYSFNEPATLMIRPQHLTKLHVTLTDEFNQKIEFANGPPTILWLEVLNMEREEEFTVTCLSLQPNSFPGNTLSQFYVPLPREMKLSGFEVSLLQMIYPPEIEESIVAWLKVGEDKWYYDISAMDSTEDFIKAVQTDLKNSPHHEKVDFGLVPEGEKYGGQLYFYRRRRHDNRNLWPIDIYPSPNFTRVCGQMRTMRAKTQLEPGRFLVFQGKPDLAAGQEDPVALLECDIIKPNTLAGKVGQLLHCVPIKVNQGILHNRMHSPASRSYHPVLDTPITRIGFKFSSPEGERRDFYTKNAKDGVIIVLVFRKKKEEIK